MDIDVVITYVNNRDSNWMREYGSLYHDKTYFNRYLDYNTLSLQIQLIRKYMSYVNNIYVVVSNESQVKKIDVKDAIVITHKQIIPEKFLPTFNSCTIEMFLHKIPNLSEYFIYFNDDMYPTSNSTIEDFFEDGKICMNFKKVEKLDSNNIFRIQCKNSCDAAKRLNNTDITDSFIKPDHICLLHTKSSYAQVWSEIGDEIESSITNRRSEKNFNQYLFALYNFYKGEVKLKKLDYRFYDSKHNLFTDTLKDICSKKYKFVCINDIGLDAKSIEKNREVLVDALRSNINDCKYNFEAKVIAKPKTLSRVAICTIAKNENRYIREWVEYYLKMGVTRIYLYDNNDVDGERFEDVINDYIISGKVEVIDRRGCEKELRDESRLNLQDKVYSECYNNHKSEYDWMWFFDIDEFLYSPSGKNIIDYINSERFSRYTTILVNWVYYGDNGLVYYDDRPVVERFTTPCDREGVTKGFRSGYQCKSIVRCGGEHIIPPGNISIHKFLIKGGKLCNANGYPVVQSSGVKISNVCFDNIVLNHYITKTIEEYLPRYVNRVDSVSIEGKRFNIDRVVKNFFSFNEKTDEKLEVIKKYQ